MSGNPADEITAPIIAALGRDVPFAMVIYIDLPSTLSDDAVGKFKAVSKVAAEGTAKEEGNLFYQVLEDLDIPRRFYLVEQWKNVAALHFHFSLPHVPPFLAFLDDHKIPLNIRTLSPYNQPVVRKKVLTSAQFIHPPPFRCFSFICTIASRLCFYCHS